MTIHIFMYNVVAIKSMLSHLKKDSDCQYILIGSDYCLDNLTEENKLFFDEIHHVKRNFHQIDLNEVDTIVMDFIQKHGSQNIRLLTNEDSTQLACASLREKYEIPGNTREQVLPFVNKVISKNMLQGNVRVPKFIPFDKLSYHANQEEYLQNVMNHIDFPMFIKPIDLVSSIDTYYIPDSSTLKSVLESISSKSWDFEIDEFIEGDLFHCDVIIQNNKIEFFMAGKYAWPLARFSKGSPMGSLPVNDSLLLDQLKKFSEDVLSCLGTFSSAFHLEVFKENKSGELIFLEIAARTPGALVPDMYQIIFNKHLEELHYQVQINPDSDLEIKKSEHQAGWITFPKIKGILSDIKKPKITINNTFLNFVKNGEQMEQAVSLLDSSCSVVFWDKSYQETEQAFEFLRNYQPLVLS